MHFWTFLFDLACSILFSPDPLTHLQVVYPRCHYLVPGVRVKVAGVHIFVSQQICQPALGHPWGQCHIMCYDEHLLNITQQGDFLVGLLAQAPPHQQPALRLQTEGGVWNWTKLSSPLIVRGFYFTSAVLQWRWRRRRGWNTIGSINLVSLDWYRDIICHFFSFRDHSMAWRFYHNEIFGQFTHEANNRWLETEVCDMNVLWTEKLC